MVNFKRKNSMSNVRNTNTSYIYIYKTTFSLYQSQDTTSIIVKKVLKFCVTSLIEKCFVWV